MYIRDIYKQKKTIISFEVFPPKQEYNIGKLYETIIDLKKLNPDFVSVTYGAGGGTRAKTLEIGSKIKNEIGIETVVHFTCVNTTKEDILNILNELNSYNIKNILALRGDTPLGQNNFTKTIGGFEYAYELVKFIKEHGDWSIAVAGYPHTHPDSKDIEEDIDYLKMKVDSGADLIVSQLFFDNKYFYKFRDLAVKKGINIPIVPGIFPILNFNGIEKAITLSNAVIPDDLYKRLEAVKDDPDATEKIGIENAVKQSEDLIKNGVPGLHFYTMNKSRQIVDIFNKLFN